MISRGKGHTSTEGAGVICKELVQGSRNIIHGRPGLQINDIFMQLFLPLIRLRLFCVFQQKISPDL